MNGKVSIYYTILLLALLGFTSYIFSFVASTNKVIATVTAYLLIISIAMLVKLDWNSVGLSLTNIYRGIIFALPIIAIIILGFLALFLINPDIFKDERYNQSYNLVLYAVFITLPLFTVLLEELAFRGVLFGMLQTIVSQNYALILSSISFGVWHLFSAGAINMSAFPLSLPKIVIVVGVVLATSLAGMFLTWTRIKSGSLITPILIHWTINATGMLFAYLAWQKQ